MDFLKQGKFEKDIHFKTQLGSVAKNQLNPRATEAVSVSLGTSSVYSIYRWECR